MGSASAFYSYLLRLQKRVTFFCVSEHIDPNINYLPWCDKITHRFPEAADLAIAFDCGAPSRLGVEVACDLVNIDHHSGNEEYGNIVIVDTGAISTTQVVYDLFKAAEVKINPKMATALYAGLLDDSAGFTVHKTDQKAFEMAADLAGCGADIALCNRRLMQTLSLAALRLKGEMFRQLQLLGGGRVAYLFVGRALLESTGAHPSDCEAALEESLHLPTVETAILLRENRDGSLKGSLRTRSGVDMARIAGMFGGGGHAHAAGFEVSGMDAETVLEQLLHSLDKDTV
jgi:phosphoesterase RecJ-like protein